MTVHNIETVDGFKEALAKNPIVIVDWFATWCGPCKAIAPQVAKWAQSMPSVHFVKVDVDALPELAQEYSVRAMPTFHIFKDGEKVDEYVSANPPALLKVIEKWKPVEEGEAE
ncbi:thioredoxin II [Diaporthe helianthi]|uniref:Thioredoxin n=1 Tax=Diaporthe helianthi TaxID=158607 RepID=A0A2P5IF24_DIAHE|nr:thioredoxin II [Diaporthe helianthi]